MKKLLCLLLAVMMCFGLFAACGDTDKDSVEKKDLIPIDQLPIETVPTSESQTEETTTEPQPEPLKLDVTNVSLSAMGEQASIYSGEVSAEEIFWYSDDSSVAAVDAGVVTALGSGTATVYAVYGDEILTCTVSSSASYGSGRTPVMAAPAYETVESSFFDDAVFVGDSISLKLSYDTSGKLGNAQFLVQGSYGVGNAIYDVLPTTYRGQTYNDLEQAIAATGAKKLFIMMGMNDIGLYGIDETIKNWGVLIGLIREACPGIEIYIQSMTPVWTGGEVGGLTNVNVNAYNVKLRQFADENDCKFIDIAPYLRDETGGLATEFCSDQYVHMSEEGVAVWIKALKAYANY